MNIFTELVSMNYPIVWVLTYLLMPFTLVLLIAFVTRLILILYKGIKKSLAESAKISIPKLSSLLAKAIEAKSDLFGEKIRIGYKNALLEINGMSANGKDARELILGNWYSKEGDSCTVFKDSDKYIMAITDKSGRTVYSFIRKIYDFVDHDIYQLDGACYEVFSYMADSERLYFPTPNRYLTRDKYPTVEEINLNESDIEFDTPATISEKEEATAFENSSTVSEPLDELPFDFEELEKAISKFKQRLADEKSVEHTKTDE